MSFDYVKFVRENQLTPTSKLKAMFEEDELDSEFDSEEGDEEGQKDPLADYFGDDAKAEEQPEAEPTSKDMKGDDIAKDATANQGKLQQLIKQKDEILGQYKNGSLSLDQYRTRIGNIPHQIKQLQAKLDPVLDDEEGSQDEIQEAVPAIPPAPKAVDKLNLKSVNSMDIKDARSYAYTLLDIATKLKSGEGFNPESDQNIKTALQLLKKAAGLAPGVPELPKK